MTSEGDKVCEEDVLQFEGDEDQVKGLGIRHLVTYLKIRDEREKIQILTIGTKSEKSTRSILLVGETGAGKTTFLNGLINALLGVQFEDNFRYKVKDELGNGQKLNSSSQTEFVTGYLLYHQPWMPYPCNFLIIDTPGLQDTKGVEEIIKIRKQMELFLREDKFGGLQLNCLAFVTKGSTNRYNSYVQNFMTEFETLFGKDTVKLTDIIATFSADENPPLKSVLQEIGFKYNKMYFFDNGCIFKYPDKAQMWERMGQMWEQAMNEYQYFLSEIMGSHSEMLYLTKEQSIQKEEMEKAVGFLKKHIKEKTTVLLRLAKCKELLANTKDIMEKNKDYISVKLVTKRNRVSIDTHAHNCTVCVKTCFHSCGRGFFFSNCPGSRGKCSMCSCDLSKHKTEQSTIDVTVTQEKDTNHEMQKVFMEAETKLNSLEEEKKDLENNLAQVSHKLSKNTGRITAARETIMRCTRAKKHKTNEQFFEQVMQEIRTEMISKSNEESDKALIITFLQKIESDCLKDVEE